MKIVFRVDAAYAIGSGHVYRCLTLANHLATIGASILFVCREHAGHLGEKIQAAGHAVIMLPANEEPEVDNVDGWLGVGQAQDAEQTLKALHEWQHNHNTAKDNPADPQVIDWLIVDHYVIDYRWHERFRTVSSQLMVIDDLADRRYCCDLLMDQTFMRTSDAYSDRLTPFNIAINHGAAGKTLLVGSDYALLRAEFAQQRTQAEARVKDLNALRQPAHKIFVNLGGADTENYTSLVVESLSLLAKTLEFEVMIVVGALYRHEQSLQEQLAEVEFESQIHRNVTRISALLLECDFAIGASGSSTWERCALGVASLLLVTADNQKAIAGNVAKFGAAQLYEMETVRDVQGLADMIKTCITDPELLARMRQQALLVCDGYGVRRVADRLQEISKYE